MRIIGGEFRSRRLKSLPGQTTRPTSDKLRETLFNVLGSSISGSVWYDCFAGSGAVGLEALSRGAAFAVFVEGRRSVATVLRQNIASLGLESRSEVRERAVLQALKDVRHPADFVFLDPPYAALPEYHRVLRHLSRSSLLHPGALVIAEHARRWSLEPRYAALARFRTLEQGSSTLSFYRLSAVESPAASDTKPPKKSST